MPKTKDIAGIGHAHRNAQKSGSSHCTPCRGHGVHAELRRVHGNHNLFDHALGGKEVMEGRDTRRDTGTPSGHKMEHQRAIPALDGRRDGRTDGGETCVLISLQQRSDHFTRPHTRPTGTTPTKMPARGMRISATEDRKAHCTPRSQCPRGTRCVHENPTTVILTRTSRVPCPRGTPSCPRKRPTFPTISAARIHQRAGCPTSLTKKHPSNQKDKEPACSSRGNPPSNQGRQSTSSTGFALHHSSCTNLSKMPEMGVLIGTQRGREGTPHTMSRNSSVPEKTDNPFNKARCRTSSNELAPSKLHTQTQTGTHDEVRGCQAPHPSLQRHKVHDLQTRGTAADRERHVVPQAKPNNPRNSAKKGKSPSRASAASRFIGPDDAALPLSAWNQEDVPFEAMGRPPDLLLLPRLLLLLFPSVPGRGSGGRRELRSREFRCTRDADEPKRGAHQMEMEASALEADSAGSSPSPAP